MRHGGLGHLVTNAFNTEWRRRGGTENFIVFLFHLPFSLCLCAPVHDSYRDQCQFFSHLFFIYSSLCVIVYPCQNVCGLKNRLHHYLPQYKIYLPQLFFNGGCSVYFYNAIDCNVYNRQNRKLQSGFLGCPLLKQKVRVVVFPHFFCEPHKCFNTE